jgi:hypothetical protein
VVEGARDMYLDAACAPERIKKTNTGINIIFLGIKIKNPPVNFWRVAPKYNSGPFHEADPFIGRSSGFRAYFSYSLPGFSTSGFL